jgi:DNA-binding NarL/FixJ family response regulator
MAKKQARKKAVRKVEKAVRKAVQKGVAGEVVERAVDNVIKKGSLKKPSAAQKTKRSKAAKNKTPTTRSTDQDVD